ncbi:MAG: hypothetical protein PHS86_02500 [Syntrophaceae bacterium]|nr:hypothetical protein [Syntrophaceae bacterium]
MIYSCIECKRIWVTAEESDQIDFSALNLDNCLDISHGICPECFQRHEDKVHRHQKNNGYSECYNRHENCPNDNCLFRRACGASAIDSWKSSIVLLRSGNLRHEALSMS